MLKSLRVRLSQGTQYIADLDGARPPGFRGRPTITEGACPSGCNACAAVCPTAAIAVDPVRLDLARCVFCDECTRACPEHKIAFGNDPRMGATTPDGLIVKPGVAPSPVETSAKLKALFGRSLKLRQVSAGGCNACELELNALANVNFDLQRYGIEWVASPRHADALVLSGPITQAMAEAVRLAWAAMPSPRFTIATGACALSGGLYADSPTLARTLLGELAPSLYVPGCPPHPLTFVTALLSLLR